MAVFSTLCLYQAKPTDHWSSTQYGPIEPSSQSEASSPKHVTVSEIPVPSMLHNSYVVLPVGILFGDDRLGYNLPASLVHDAWQGHGRVEAPTDGETSWYCSECGDGPYGSWQNCCQACSHAKCGSCKVEYK